MENPDFVPYKESLALKELGFDEECFAWTMMEEPEFVVSHCSKYKNEFRKKNMLQIPLWQQAFKWFRDNYNFHHYIEPIHRDGKVKYEYCVVDSSHDDKEFTEEDIADSYEEAELECLRKLIEICQEKR